MKITRRLYSRKFQIPALRFDYKLPPYNHGLSFEDCVAKRRKFLSPSLATFQAFQNPFYLTRAKMQYLWDEKGQRYLDLLAQNLTISVGHNHDYVVAAAKKQMDTLVHSTTMYYNDVQVRLAEKFVSKLPKGEDWVVHFVNSGSEAIDLAIMVARTYTGNFDVLAIRNSYHGLQAHAMGVTGLAMCKQNTPTGFGVHHVLQPDLYRGYWGKDDPDHAKKYAQDVADVINYSTPGRISSFIYEQVQGFGGICPMPEGYITEAFKHVKEAGGVTIADEVQTGFGRMGKCYWAFELEKGAVPDIICVAKGLGNGLPIAAVAMKREIAESMSKKAYFNTYGGNPTVAAVADAVLDTIENDKCQELSRDMGALYRKEFLKLQKKHSIIGDIRGHGLMMGVEIVTDPKKKTPGTKLATEAFEMIRNNGVIMGKGGRFGNILRVMSPMCLNEEDVKFTVDVCDYVFGEVSKRGELFNQ